MPSLDELIRASWKDGSPTDWFEDIYANAAQNGGRVPWAYMQPNPEMVAFLDERQLSGGGQKALVVGCGLGDDAEELAARGFSVKAFDVSPSAIDTCRQRFPDSGVDYQVADLLNPPDVWTQAFSFVLENRTIQALPHHLTEQAIANIAGFVGRGGRVLVMCHGREPHEPRNGIPWPLSRQELALFDQNGLTEQTFNDFSRNGVRRFVVEYIRSK